MTRYPITNPCAPSSESDGRSEPDCTSTQHRIRLPRAHQLRRAGRVRVRRTSPNGDRDRRGDDRPVPSSDPPRFSNRGGFVGHEPVAFLPRLRKHEGPVIPVHHGVPLARWNPKLACILPCQGRITALPPQWSSGPNADGCSAPSPVDHPQRTAQKRHRLCGMRDVAAIDEASVDPVRIDQQNVAR